MLKIIKNPQVEKPLKYKRSERAICVKPFRLIYSINKDELILLKFEHRKNV
jgi:mRNA-degrading endonuclease RelE of RelBE toxin-antitoxin system